MGNGPEIPADWTELERRVWERIAAGEPADLNARPDQKNLDPHTEDGWSEDRRLTAKFFQDILMQKAFVEATPSGGVRILGALIDDAPLNLEHARLQHHFWLEESRILTDVNCLYLRVAGVLSLEKCFVAGAVDLSAAEIGSALFRNATFKGGLTLTGAKISSELAISQSTFEADVSLDSTTVGGHALLLNATFEAGLGMAVAKIGSNLLMSGATFEGNVNVNSATVGGHALLRRVTVKGALDLTAAKIGAGLDMSASTFGRVSLNAAKVGGAAFLRRSSFNGTLDLATAKIGAGLDMGGATFEGDVTLKGCTVTGDFLLGFSESSAARWKDGASLTLRNAHVGAWQDWWRDDSVNAWPKSYELEGFTYDRLGSSSAGKEADMLHRPVASYIEWLAGDSDSSPQPYEQLARRFQEAGLPYNRDEVLYATRERQRHKAWSTVGHYGPARRRESLHALGHALGLSALRMTIGYGLGAKYFRALGWVVGLTLVGTLMLIVVGSHSLAEWWPVFFASLDQLLPIVTLDKAHDALVFGDLSAMPPVYPQPYGVLVYFYAHKIAGWVLGSFLVAGLAGLTQRN